MNIKYIPLLMISFAVIADNNTEINSLTEHTRNFYNVTYTIKKDDRIQNIFTQAITQNTPTPFEISKSTSYIKDKTITYNWYHKLFGIEPNPIYSHGVVKTGLQGFIILSEVSENEVFVEVNSHLSELVNMEKLDELESPHLEVFDSVQKTKLSLNPSNNCLEINPYMNVCITKQVKY
ncbi:hypothetical protein F0M16_10935 [Vibrio cholerae]|uniref:Uncharacterized protein n=1 Tax=Vibrio cholerae TaxID=666 RepID=A0A5Q6PIV5_VIBCL|nr:hypothetical protein [Vibrio cholerae]KAA1254774.1 hypothetical protein F0M16_10935 [Vibrio cholerae]